MNCNHPECDCTTTTVDRDGKSYCSTACATGAARMAGDDEGCGCGHPDCGAETAKAGAGSRERGGSISARGAEGSPAGMSAGGGEGHPGGLRGDGRVGDTAQRKAEAPGRGTDDSRKMSLSQEDRAGAPMKPGAVQQRGIGSPQSGDDRRAGVRRGSGEPEGQSIEAPGRDDRGI